MSMTQTQVNESDVKGSDLEMGSTMSQYLNPQSSRESFKPYSSLNMQSSREYVRPQANRKYSEFNSAARAAKSGVQYPQPKFVITGSVADAMHREAKVPMKMQVAEAKSSAVPLVRKTSVATAASSKSDQLTSSRDLIASLKAKMMQQESEAAKKISEGSTTSFGLRVSDSVKAQPLQPAAAGKMVRVSTQRRAASSERGFGRQASSERVSGKGAAKGNAVNVSKTQTPPTRSLTPLKKTSTRASFVAGKSQSSRGMSLRSSSSSRHPSVRR